MLLKHTDVEAGRECSISATKATVRSTPGLTESSHGVVDVAGWAYTVYVDSSYDKLVLGFW